jgi:hypothetical protein
MSGYVSAKCALDFHQKHRVAKLDASKYKNRKKKKKKKKKKTRKSISETTFDANGNARKRQRDERAVTGDSTRMETK